jgi:hypothetical protein
LFKGRGSIGIRANDDIGNYFQALKGLPQGDPLSPMLCNIVVDMLAILIARANEDGLIESPIPHLVEGVGGRGVYSSIFGRSILSVVHDIH